MRMIGIQFRRERSIHLFSFSIARKLLTLAFEDNGQSKLDLAEEIGRAHV